AKLRRTQAALLFKYKTINSCTMTKTRTLIGKGAFSKVYLLPDRNTVEIISSDPAKECLALFGFGESYLWPAIERIEQLNDGKQVYHMPYFPRVKSLKDSLEPKQWLLYKALRSLPRVLSTKCAYNEWGKSFAT